MGSSQQCKEKKPFNCCKFIGRLILATMLIVAAFHHLRNTQLYCQSYAESISAIYNVAKGKLPDNQTEEYKNYVYENLVAFRIIKFIGVIKGGISILLLFGDQIGIRLYILFKFFRVLFRILSNYSLFFQDSSPTDYFLSVFPQLCIFLGMAFILRNDCIQNSLPQSQHNKRKSHKQ